MEFFKELLNFSESEDDFKEQYHKLDIEISDILRSFPDACWDWIRPLLGESLELDKMEDSQEKVDKMKVIHSNFVKLNEIINKTVKSNSSSPSWFSLSITMANSGEFSKGDYSRSDEIISLLWELPRFEKIITDNPFEEMKEFTSGLGSFLDWENYYKIKDTMYNLFSVVDTFDILKQNSFSTGIKLDDVFKWNIKGWKDKDYESSLNNLAWLVPMMHLLTDIAISYDEKWIILLDQTRLKFKLWNNINIKWIFDDLNQLLSKWKISDAVYIAESVLDENRRENVMIASDIELEETLRKFEK